MSGEWKLEVSFMGKNQSHSFWVNATPPPAPVQVLANNAYNGLWYDPDLSGEGFNFITSPSGTVIFFYGSDKDGNRIWMISETITENLAPNVNYSFVMYESTGGVWDNPISSGRGLSIWGELNLFLEDCGNGLAELRGVDGLKLSDIQKLAGVPGTGCINGVRADNLRSGLWYDQSLSGEGFNFIVAPNGVVIFYYGFDEGGKRLWMHSDTIPDVFTVGGEFTSSMNRASMGTFDSPVAGALQDWGDITVKVNSCSSLTVTMDTMEGIKVSQAVQLAPVIGLACP
jgi:hypothetical protein